MKIIKTFATLSLISILVSCNSQPTKSLNQLTAQQPETISTVISTVNTTSVLDSLKQIDNQIVLLRNTKESKISQIIFLTNKIDSLKNAITQLEKTISEVKSRKIEPGINGVSKKLEELRGLRENSIEQQNLQKREIALADKKISLLNEEKVVYNEHRKALWNKGVAPQYFKEVDSLLTDVDKGINQQKTRFRGLKTSVNDIQDKTSNIERQRISLSSNIRDNYKVQEILEDFSKEEKVRLTTQLRVLELKLKGLIEEDLNLNNSLAINKAKKNIFASDQQKLENQKEILKHHQLKLLDNKIDRSIENKSSAKNRRVIYAIMGVLALILVLYLIGKKSKGKK